MESPHPSIKKRFERKYVVQDNGCWQWSACSNGYGRFSIYGKVEYAHRVSWFLHKGSWPKLLVCHSCDNPVCVNPDHLFEGTDKDNLADAAGKGRMGRPYTLSITERDKIRELYKLGNSQRQIAKMFGTTQATVSECCRYKHEPKVL